MYSPKLYRQDGAKTQPRFESTIFDGIMWVTTCMTLSPDILQYINMATKCSSFPTGNTSTHRPLFPLLATKQD